MTTEQLRDLYLKDIDDALDSWVLMRRLTEEQKRRLRANRSFLQNASAEVLQSLLSWYEREPARQESESTTTPPLTYFSQWRKKGEPAYKVYCLLDIINDRAELGTVGLFHKQITYIPMAEFLQEYEPFAPDEIGPTTEASQ